MANTIFITGVSSGIGRGLAAEYLEQGATVWGVSRRAPDGLLTGYSKFHFQSVDLTDAPEVEQQLPKLLAECEGLDTVVLNAGAIGRIADMPEVPLGDLRALMEINVWANKTVLDSLFRQGFPVGRVISISSGAAVTGKRGWSGYAISKAAMTMMAQLYASEQPDTWFASVAPGLVDTAMQDFLCGHSPDSRFDSLEVLKSKRDTDEMPKPEQIAGPLVRLIEGIESQVESGGFIDIRQIKD